MPSIGQLLVELSVNTGAFVEGMDKATYKAKQSAKEIGESFRGLGKDIGGVLNSFGEFGGVIGDALTGVGETISKVAGQFGSLGGAAGAAAIGITAVGAVAVAAGAGLAKLAVEGAEIVHNLEMVSAKTGISVRDLQTLQAAGQTVGLSLDGMVQGFRKFDQAITQSGRGSTQAKSVLQALGVTSTDAKEALLQVADAFQKMPDGAVKSADAVALFGRSGLNMIPFLDKGRAGIEEFNQLVEEYGPRIGEDAVKANEEYLKSQLKLNLAWESMKVDVEAKVLPVISKLIAGMGDASKASASLWTEITSHPWDSLKAVLSSGSATGASVNLALLSAANDQVRNTGASKASKEAEARAKAESDAARNAREYFDTVKDGGPAEQKLAETQEQINAELTTGTSQSILRAAALQQTIPALQKAAELEKQRKQYELDPKETVLGTNKVNEMTAALSDQLNEQRQIAAAIVATTASLSIETAGLKEQTAIEKQRRDLTTQAQTALNERSRQNAGTQQWHDADAKLQDYLKQLDELDAIQGKLVAMAQTKAALQAGNAAVDGLVASNQSLQEQIANLTVLQQVYANFGATQRDLNIATTTTKEAVAVQKANDAYQALLATVGAAPEDIKAAAASVEKANVLFDQAKQKAGQIYDIKTSNTLAEEARKAEADAASWEILTAAIGANAQARIAASIAAAEAKARALGQSPEQVQYAGQNAGREATQQAINTILQKSAQLDLNAALQNEVEELKQIQSTATAGSTVMLLAQAREKQATTDIMNEWIKAAESVGTFQQRGAAMLEQLALNGQSFWQDFQQEGLTALTSVENEIAKFAVTGKANFRQVATSFEESFAKNSLNYLVGQGAQSLLGGTALGGLLPGLAGQKNDGSSAALALWVQMSPSTIGSLPTNAENILNMPSLTPSVSGGGGALGILGSLGSLFGLPFLADGGDVTPGKAYVVGENAPEFFVPKQPGKVSPELSMGGPKVTQNVTHVHFHGITNGDDFRRNRTQIGQHIMSAVGQASSRR